MRQIVNELLIFLLIFIIVILCVRLAGAPKDCGYEVDVHTMYAW